MVSASCSIFPGDKRTAVDGHTNPQLSWHRLRVSSFFPLFLALNPPTHPPTSLVLLNSRNPLPRLNPPFPHRTDCPCCVAGALGVSCQGGSDVGVGSDGSFVEKAKAFYWDGGTPMVAAFGGLIGLGLVAALCCCRDIRKAVSRCMCDASYGCTHGGMYLL